MDNQKLLEFEYSDFQILKKQINLNLYDIVYGKNNISIVYEGVWKKGIVELKIIKKKKNNDDINKNISNEELIKIKNNKSDDWVYVEKDNGKIKETNIKINNNENDTELIKEKNLIIQNTNYLENITKITKIEEQERKLKEIIQLKDEMQNYKEKYTIELRSIIKEIENNMIISKKLKNEIGNNKEKELVILEIEKLKKEYNLITKKIKENNIVLEKQKEFINLMEGKLKYKNEMINHKIDFEKQIKLLLNSIENKFLEEIKISNEEKINIYLNEMKELEKGRKEKFEEIMKNNEKDKLELIKISKLSNIKHYNKKCKKCGEEPIEGILYKCSECKEYYLCEKCEQINYLDKSHIHNFIKIRKPSNKYNIEQKLLENNKSNLIELNKDNKLNNYNNENYSFEFKIEENILSKDEENKIIKLIIKNNGINQWIKNETFLKMELNEYFSCDDIELDCLKPNDSQEINLLLKEKKDLKEKNYTLLFNFYIQNKIYGNPLSIDIEFIA